MALSSSAPQATSLIVSVLLIEITQTFRISIGEASQMIGFCSVLGIFTSLIMTLLAVRYSPTHIHNVGLVLCVLSVLGSIVAPSYSVFFLLYGLYIVGSKLVLPMTTTIMGGLFSGEERSKSLGVIFAGQAVFFVLGYLFVGFISEWRLAFAYFAAPFIVLSLLVALRVIPLIEVGGKGASISMGVRSIYRSRSAVFCLVSSSISGVWSVALGLATSFYRDVHGIPLSTVTVLTAGMALLYAFGALAGGRFVYRLGMKKANAFLRILMGVSLILLMGTGNTFFSVVMGFVLSLLSGANTPAGSGLRLGLVPEYKGSMMSLNSAAASLGSGLNLALMGYLMISYGWATGGIVVGGLGIIGGVIIHLFVTENPD